MPTMWGMRECSSRNSGFGSGHGGGDSGIVEDFLALMEGRQGEASSDISHSVESHMMAFAADEACVRHTVVDIADFRRRHRKE